MIRKTFAILLSVLLGACAGIDPGDYATAKPTLDLARYFSGTVDGWGMVQDRAGRVTRRFTVRIEGAWRGDIGTLDEAFVWSDGSTQQRVWTVERQGEGRYIGNAADIIGTAAGVASGNALHWTYVLQLPPEQGGYAVDLDDWMFLIDEQTLLNRTEIRKFGIRFGEITIAFRRRPG